MEGILRKKEDGTYLLIVNDKVVATSSEQKLSLENCQSVELGYDLGKLKKEFANNHKKEKDMAYEYGRDMFSFKMGFQKALEILGDRKFTEDDMQKAMQEGMLIQRTINDGVAIPYFRAKKYIASLQKTEWDVEIEMAKTGTQFSPGATRIQDSDYLLIRSTPILDENSCLILKRK